MRITEKLKAEDRAEGRTEGRAEDRAEGILEIAKRLKEPGLPLTEIAKATELSIDTINNLK